MCEFVCFLIVLSVFQTYLTSSETLLTLLSLRITFIIPTFDQNCVEFFTKLKRILWNCGIWRDNYFEQLATTKSKFRKIFKLKSYEKLQIATTECAWILKSQKTREKCFMGLTFEKCISKILNRIELKKFEFWVIKTPILNLSNQWHKNLFCWSSLELAF